MKMNMNPLTAYIAVRGFVMVLEYTVIQNDAPVGQVQLAKEGLYYVIQCQVNLAKPGTYRLWAQTGEHSLDLGICVPYGGCFGLQTRIPAKKINPNQLRFLLKDSSKIQCIPVFEDQPFSCIQLLEKGKLCMKEGTPCISFDA